MESAELNKEEIVKASLIGGLKLWGPPAGDYGDAFTLYTKKFGINPKDFGPSYDSGLIWYWDNECPIAEINFSERLLSLNVKDILVNPMACMGNIQISEEEYVFRLDGTGSGGYDSDEELLDPALRSADGKMYIYYIEGAINIYNMDIGSREEALACIKKFVEENKK